VENVSASKRSLVDVFTASLICWNGVDEIKKMRLSLTGFGEQFYSIYGLGGVGKTQLALKYVDAYYSHVFWVVADTEFKLDTAFREIVVGPPWRLTQHRPI